MAQLAPQQAKHKQLITNFLTDLNLCNPRALQQKVAEMWGMFFDGLTMVLA